MLYRDISTIFIPDSAVTDPSDLVARRDQIKRLLQAMSRDATIPIVSGPPGIGKTSVLNVASFLLRGFDDELARLNLDFYRPPERNRQVIWVQCGTGMRDEDDLALHVLSNVQIALDAAPEQSNYRLREFSLTGQLPIATLAASWQRVSNADTQRATAHLSALLTTHSLAHDCEVVLMLDECEHLPWLRELFAFLRQFDEVAVRFVLGMRDHAVYRLREGEYGDYRSPSEIEVTRLSDTEVADFFERAASRDAELGVQWLVDPSVISHVARQSSGEPWYLQMIGAEISDLHGDGIASMLATGDDPRIRVTLDDCERAERTLVERRLRGYLGALYSELVASSPVREEVLQALAAYPATLIPDAFLKFVAQNRIPSTRRVVRDLLDWRGQPILRVVDAPQRGVEFDSHAFKVYCRVAPVTAAGTRHFAGELVRGYLGHPV